MKEEKLKRYQVTQSLRFPSNIIKAMYYAGSVLLVLGAAVLALGFFTPLASLRGLSAIVVVLSAIWLISAHFISANSFGLANISFTGTGMIFRTGGEEGAEYRLNWEDVRCCGLIKTRRSWWCYASDHELADKERREFPEFVEKGVFYFNYADNTWEEFMKFVPERFRAELEKEKKEKAVK